jgi:hypothetical protein
MTRDTQPYQSNQFLYKGRCPEKADITGKNKKTESYREVSPLILLVFCKKDFVQNLLT